MESLHSEIKSPAEIEKSQRGVSWKAWLSLAVLLLFLGGVAFYLYHEDSSPGKNKPAALATVEPVQDAPLQVLLSNAIIHFSPIESEKVLAPGQTMSADLSIFINKDALDTQTSFINYQDKTIGFYATYTAPAATAAELYQADSAAAKSGGWNILYGASSTQAAVIEATNQFMKTLYKVQVQYQNEVGGNVGVTAQYILSLQK